MAHTKATQSYKNLNFPEREDMEGLIRFQSSILEAIAFGYDDKEILDRICLLGEKVVPDSVATIMLLDDADRLNIHAAPGASEEITSRLNGLVPGPEAGSCGNATYRKEPVFVADTFHDPRWKGLKSLAREYNLHSCWSMPIFSAGRKVIGTFALTGFETRSPSPFQIRLMEIVSSIIAIVLERVERSNALKKSEERFRILFEEATDAKMLISEEGRILDINRIGHERLGYAKEEMRGRLVSEFVTLENVEKVAQRLTRVKQEGHATYESAQVRKDGTVMPIEISTIIIELDGRSIYYSILRDITERKKTEMSLHDSEKRFRDLVETTTDWIWETDADFRYTYVSPRIKDLLGYRPEELIGKTPFDMMPDEVARQRAQNAKTYIEKQAPIDQVQTTRLHRDGHEVFVETSGLPILDGTGQLIGYRGVTRDITRRKEMENALRESETHLRDIVLHAPIGLATVSLEGRFMDANQSLSIITGYRKEELLALTFQEITHPEDLESDLDNARKLISGEIPFYKMEKRYVRKDGSIVWIQLTASLLRNPEGTPMHFIAQIEDISERIETKKRLNHLAYYDTLTDLPNRRFLIEKFEWALVQAKRHDRSLAIMFLDLDGFKQVNDGLGHDIGDELLKAVAVRLASCVRKGDIVSRQGGDEFIIVLPEISHPNDAALVAEKIIDSLKMPVEVGTHRVRIGTSIGIAVYPIDGNEDAGDLMKKADQAMYAVKASGKNGYLLFGN